jgi:type IV pilus assembly protein PilB
MITPSALDEVLALQRVDGRRLGTLLVERALINETQLTQILSHQLSVPWVSLLHIEFSRQLLNLVPRDVADRFCLVPIYVRHVRNQGDTLYVAMDDPSNEDGLTACREHAGLPVRSMIAPPSDIRSAIRVYYGVDTPVVSVPSPAAMSVGPKEEPSTRREPSGAKASAPPASPTPNTALAPATPSPPPDEAVPASPPPLETPPPPMKAAPVRRAPTLTSARHDLPAGVPAEPPPGADADQPSTKPDPAAEMPHIETVEIEVDLSRVERFRGALGAPDDPPSSQVIPHPRGRAPRMVALTLLDGTTITLPAKRKAASAPAAAQAEQAEQATPAPDDAPAAGTSEPPADDPLHHLTARDLAMALRVVAHGADASEVLGEDMRWEALFSALLSLLLKKHVIADWEFVDELKKRV